MRNFIIAIVLLIITTSVFAQDTIKYGDPQYLFNRRTHSGLKRNMYLDYIIDYAHINDTTGMTLSPIVRFTSDHSRENRGCFYSPMFYTNTPIRIYGIALNLFHMQGTASMNDSVALFQYSNGLLKLLRVSDNCTRTNLFMFEGEYIYDNPIDSCRYVGRNTALSYCHEFFFDTPVSVHDTFLVWIKPANPGIVPEGVNIRNIPLYDSIGYPDTPDSIFSERYSDMDLVYSGLKIFSDRKIYSNRVYGHYDGWGMAFPIIMPLDGVDTLGEINPDSLWYYIPDSLCMTDVPTEPEVSLAPNPATGSSVLTADVQVSRLLMHNVDGRLVRELKPEATRVEINLAGLPKGLYIISAVTPQGTAHQKIIVR